MSFIDNSQPVPVAISIASPRDYFALLKPRVMSLVVFSAFAGLLLSPTHVNPVIGFAALFAIAVGAGAAGALNMWYDADVDALMRRTRNRPVPGGRVTPAEALAFGLILSAFSVFALGVMTNWLAGAFLAFTIFFYVVVYTMWLKRTTPQNIVIGGAAGAFPPMVAYVAATGQFSLSSFVLFAIIFMWTPPHFWALAIVKSEEYALAGIPMMPNARGHDRTRLEILLYSIGLAPVGCLPWALGFASWIYGVTAALLGVVFVALAVQVFVTRTAPLANRRLKTLFFFSIFYLFALLAVIVVERLVAIGFGHIG